jgi:hypothetical protein
VRRWLVIGLSLGLGLGCADGDDACVAVGGEFAVTLGPGTGTCGALDLGDLLDELDPLAIAAGEPCGRQPLVSVSASGECTTGATLEAVVGEEAVSDGVLRVTSTCTADGSTCQHSFLVTFTRVAAGQAGW